MAEPPLHPLARLERAGLLRRERGRFRTSRRFQGAMARAALRLVRAGDDRGDLRLPLALALVEVFGSETPDAELVDLVEAMLPIETEEVDPARRVAPGAR